MDQTPTVLLHQDKVFWIERYLKYQLNCNLYKKNGTLLFEESDNHKQIYRWVRINLNLPSVQVQTYTEWEFLQKFERRILDKSIYSEILVKYGVTKSTITYFLEVILLPLIMSSLNHLWNLMGVVKITSIIVRELIEKIVVTKKGKKLTFSITKKHTLCQHQKQMGHMDSQEIYRPSVTSYTKCSITQAEKSSIMALNHHQHKNMLGD